MRNARNVILVSLATTALLIVTEPGMSVVWDEGYTLGRIQRVRLWFSAMINPEAFARDWQPPLVELVQQQGLSAPSASQVSSRSELLFNPRVIGWFWPFAREEPHGHPPFYALVGLIGDLLTPWREPLGRARLGTILFHGLAAGFLWYSISRRYGPSAAVIVCLAWSLSPHVFALAHYATYDSLLNSLWIMGILASAEAFEASSKKSVRRFDVIAGLILGAAMATKLTGWFLVLPMSLPVLLSRFSKGRLRGLILSLTVALFSVYFWNPSWWSEPVSGPIRFFESNLNRARTIPIETLYLGKVYKTPAESLPWSNTLVLTVMATPVMLLAFAVSGLISLLRANHFRNFSLMVLVGWLIPMILRALPHTPGHDGTRQLIAALGCSCLLAGIGAGWLNQIRPKLLKWMGIGLGVELIGSLLLFYPVPLSYFSPVVGSLPGASRLGMEPTYYWDSLTKEALVWINSHSEDGDKIAFAGTPTSFLYLNQVGELRPPVDPRVPGSYRWFVLQNRPGNLGERERMVVQDLKPAYTYSKMGVWLVAVYDMDEVQRLWNRMSERQK